MSWREIKEKTQGIQIGDVRVRLLLYADDIVLLAENKRDLQNMLDIVTSYSRKWRFRVNPKKGKRSDVVRQETAEHTHNKRVVACRSED